MRKTMQVMSLNSLGSLVGCVLSVALASGLSACAQPPKFSYTKPEHALGSHFAVGDDARYGLAPRLREIELPDRIGVQACWGASGRDDKGRLYFGITSYGVENASAYVMRYTPNANQVEVLGDVNSHLSSFGDRRTDGTPEIQTTAHSKLFQALDGKIYFGSHGIHELDDGSRNPKFGGRLMRIDPEKNTWESVITADQGMIATACAGRRVYALGYYGNVLYQYDTQTSRTKSLKVGTYKGHTTRNFFVDKREHVYVPQVQVANGLDPKDPAVSMIGPQAVKSWLVEFNPELEEVTRWPLPDYQPSGDSESHGITAFCHLEDGSIAFLTHIGSLFLLKPTGDDAGLTHLGWLHAGKRYAATLFCPTGKDKLYSFARINGFELVEYDLSLKQSRIVALDEKSQAVLKTPDLLVYGCNTMDDAGNAYLVGWKKIPRGYGPIAIEMKW